VATLYNGSPGKNFSAAIKGGANRSEKWREKELPENLAAGKKKGIPNQNQRRNQKKTAKSGATEHMPCQIYLQKNRGKKGIKVHR